MSEGNNTGERRANAPGAALPMITPQDLGVFLDAAKNGRNDVIRELSGKYDPSFLNEKDGDGETALIWAAVFARSETISLLLDLGADANTRDNKGRIALMYAAHWLDRATVTLVLDKTSDIDARSLTGMTSLMYASVNDNREAVAVLLARGANVDFKDDAGRTVLDFAKCESLFEITEMVEKALDDRRRQKERDDELRVKAKKAEDARTTVALQLDRLRQHRPAKPLLRKGPL